MAFLYRLRARSQRQSAPLSCPEIFGWLRSFANLSRISEYACQEDKMLARQAGDAQSGGWLEFFAL
jgi:hypothetical protein